MSDHADNITPQQIADLCIKAMAYQGELPPAVRLIADNDLLSACSETDYDGNEESVDEVWISAKNLAEDGQFSQEAIYALTSLTF